jgi:hypothetical protein
MVDTAPSLDTSTRVNGLTKIGEFRLARWTNRREIEWKISASIWAFLVAICSGIMIKQFSPPLLPLAVLLGITVALHFWWVHQNWKRNREDIKAAFDCFEEVHGLTSTRPLPERVRADPRIIFQDAVPTSEIAISVLLSVIAFYLAYLVPK